MSFAFISGTYVFGIVLFLIAFYGFYDNIPVQDREKLMNTTLTSHKISSQYNDKINVWIRESDKIIKFIEKIKNKSNIDMSEKKVFLNRMSKKLETMLKEGLKNGNGEDYEEKVKELYMKNMKLIGNVLTDINTKSEALANYKKLMLKLNPPKPKPEPIKKPSEEPKQVIKKLHKRKKHQLFNTQFEDVPQRPEFNNANFPEIVITENEKLVNNQSNLIPTQNQIASNCKKIEENNCNTCCMQESKPVIITRVFKACKNVCNNWNKDNININLNNMAVLIPNSEY